MRLSGDSAHLEVLGYQRVVNQQAVGGGIRWKLGSTQAAIHGESDPSSQDVDSCYMDKTELQARMEILTQEVDFLRTLYNTVKNTVPNRPLLPTKNILSNVEKSADFNTV